MRYHSNRHGDSLFHDAVAMAPIVMLAQWMLFVIIFDRKQTPLWRSTPFWFLCERCKWDLFPSVPFKKRKSSWRRLEGLPCSMCSRQGSPGYWGVHRRRSYTSIQAEATVRDCYCDLIKHKTGVKWGPRDIWSVVSLLDVFLFNSQYILQMHTCYITSIQHGLVIRPLKNDRLVLKI